MRYAFTTFALIITLIAGFLFGAYYMYNKYNPKAQTQEASTEDSVEEPVDDSVYYDSDGNWIFKYGADESGYGGSSTTVSAGGQASENIDYRITGTNFVYEDDGIYSGFHAVVTVENIGSNNLYLGRDSVFNIEDRTLSVVDSYDYVRAVPDVIAPGEKGYFYVPYGQIKTNEDSVTIEEEQLSGDVLDAGDENAVEGNVTDGSDSNAIDIEELEKALGIESEDGESSSEDESTGEATSASIKVDAPMFMASADDATEGASDGKTTLEKDDDSKSDKTSDKADDSKSDKASDNSDDSKKSDNRDDKSGDSGDADSASESSDDSKSADSSDEKAGEEDAENNESAESSEDASTEEGAEGGENAAEEPVEEEPAEPEYPGLSLYKVNEYFIMPVLDVRKCADDPRADFDIDNIVYGSNEEGYFTLSADVSNRTEANVDYIPVTVVALDRRRNAIAVGRDSLTDFYSGATKSFGVSYVLTREQRSNIVQCVVYAREAVSQ